VVLKIVGLALVWSGCASFLLVSTTDPRGLLRRAGSAYAAGLDTDFRAMFMPERGGEIAWMQVVAVVACIACHAIVRVDAVLGVALAAAIVPRAIVTAHVRKRRAKVDAQAHGFALALANTLKTTANVRDALRLTADVSQKPLRDEIDTALREIRVGSTAEEALLAASARARSPALDVVVSAVLIGQKTGGDLPRILEGTSSSLRELKRLEELTDRVTKSAKQSLMVAAALTAGLAIMLPRVVPGFFDPFIATTSGRVVASQCVLAYVVALFLGWRFTRKSI